MLESRQREPLNDQPAVWARVFFARTSMSRPNGHGFHRTILGLMAESLLIFAGAVALTAGLILLGYALARTMGWI